MQRFARLWCAGMVVAAATLALPAQAEVRDDVMASFNAMVEHGKFRSTTLTTDKKATRRSQSTAVWPNRFHVVSPEMEMILLPGKTWMKQGDQWQPLPMDMSRVAAQLTPDAMRQGFDNMTNARELPRETIGGKEARVFEYDTWAKILNIRADSHVKLWVDADTLLPLQQHVDGKALGQSTRAETTYEFDDSIKVEAPN